MSFPSSVLSLRADGGTPVPIPCVQKLRPFYSAIVPTRSVLGSVPRRYYFLPETNRTSAGKRKPPPKKYGSEFRRTSSLKAARSPKESLRNFARRLSDISVRTSKKSLNDNGAA